MKATQKTVIHPATGEVSTGSLWTAAKDNDLEMGIRAHVIVPGSLWANAQILLNYHCR